MNLWLALVLAATPARSVDGGLTEAEIADVFELHAADFAPCFEKAKQRKKASVKYRFEVNDGRVTKMGFVDSTQLDSAGTTCVDAGLEKTNFPSRADAGTTVDWTFTAPTPSPRTEPEVATLEQLAPLDEFVSGCYALGPLNEKTEGTLTLDLAVLRSGAIASISLVDQSKQLELIHLGECVQGRLLSASLEKTDGVRHLRAGWVLATSERRAKAFFIPGEPRREIIADPATVKSVGGGLDKDVIMGVIRKGNPQIKYCYETVLQRKPTLSGKVSIAWVIGPEGDVVSASVAESSTNDPSVENCIVERVKSWTFPKPVGGGVVNVTFPWILKPAGE